MGTGAGVKATFYDSAENAICSVYMDCYKFAANCEQYKIPDKATSVRICFTTEDEGCCECREHDSDDDDDMVILTEDEEEEEEEDDIDDD